MESNEVFDGTGPYDPTIYTSPQKCRSKSVNKRHIRTATYNNDSSILCGLNKYSVLLSSNMLRNASHAASFTKGKRNQVKYQDYHINVPYYKVNLDSAYKRTPSPTFGIGNRKVFSSTRDVSPPPGIYNLSSPFDTKKCPNKCSFGKRPSSTLKTRDPSPGPGEYPVPSFVNLRHGKKFSFYPRIIGQVGKIQTPAPTAYNANYSQVDISKTTSFGKGSRTDFGKSEMLGPGKYLLRSKFDDIAEFQQKKKRVALNLKKMRAFSPLKAKRRNKSILNETVA